MLLCPRSHRRVCAHGTALSRLTKRCLMNDRIAERIRLPGTSFEVRTQASGVAPDAPSHGSRVGRRESNLRIAEIRPGTFAEPHPIAIADRGVLTDCASASPGARRVASQVDLDRSTGPGRDTRSEEVLAFRPDRTIQRKRSSDYRPVHRIACANPSQCSRLERDDRLDGKRLHQSTEPVQ